MWKQVLEIIKPNGAMAFMGKQPFTSFLNISNLKYFRYELIWDKRKGSNPFMAPIMPMQSHETISIFYKKKPTYNAQMTDGEPYKIPKTGGMRTNRIIGLKPDKVGFTQKTKDTSKRYPLSIQHFSIHCGSKIHPTQKPVELMEWLIRTYTNENETVLDFAMGSGTTGVACINANRNFIGIELDKEYFQIAKKRIIHAKANKEELTIS